MILKNLAYYLKQAELWINESGEIDGEAESMQFLNNFISS
jgi:hypothetical protein